MKQILIIHSNMELGGAETSLLGLLYSIDYTKYQVDLLLFEQKGELLKYIPKNVHLISPPVQYLGLVLPIKDVLFKQHHLFLTLARVWGRIKGRNAADRTYATKEYAHRCAMHFLQDIPRNYDAAISFIDPHYVVAQKVNSKIKMGWLHTDFSRIEINKQVDFPMWNALDYIVNVSDACKAGFDRVYPELCEKSIVIENILSVEFITQQAKAFSVNNEMRHTEAIKLLSIGRFCTAKNFDNVPEICAKIRASGLNVVWYLIGYGGDESLIHQKISEAGMESYVIVLGKKENPYPYIKACDLYVQPSRYEGKCVTVREAQILGKPVVITDYATASSQLENDVDGLIVPMDNQKCAEALSTLLNDPDRMAELARNCTQRNYSNAQEVQKLYQLMEA